MADLTPIFTDFDPDITTKRHISGSVPPEMADLTPIFTDFDPDFTTRRHISGSVPPDMADLTPIFTDFDLDITPNQPPNPHMLPFPFTNPKSSAMTPNITS